MIKDKFKQIAAHVTPAERRVLLVVVIIFVLGVIGSQLVWANPKVVYPSGPSLGKTQISRSNPIVIVFSHPVQSKSLRYAIHPKLKGEWDLQTNFFAGESKLFFIPSESPELETRYTIDLTGIKPFLGGQSTNYLLSFQTDSLPIFTSVSPSDVAVDVMPDAPIVVTFDKPIGDDILVTITVTPEVPFEPPVIEGKTATFPHNAQFQKSTVYSLKTFITSVKVNYATGEKIANEDRREISITSFTTVAAPGIKSYVPSGAGVDPGTTIRIEFQQAMDRPSTESALSMTPPITGSFTWENDTSMIFTPASALAKDQMYSVTLAPTAKSGTGVTTDETLTFSFTTLGAVTVTSFAPGSGAKGVDPNTTVRTNFNQEVVHASAENKFSISPSAVGTFSWDGNVMIWHPASALNHNTTYTVVVDTGVQSVKGSESTSNFSSTFTTRNQSVMLSVPAYRQAHVYTCMIAAARSALAFRGISVSESNIISKVGIDPTKWSGTWGGDNGVWGDPDVAIVGPLDNAEARSPAGKQTTNVYWGYGSHWGPIAKAMTSYGVINEVKTGMTVQQLAQSIADGNPVIIWWVNGIWPSYEVRWKTPSGKSIRGVNGLHVQVVRGFTGSVDDPISFTVTDSGYGYPGRTFDIGTFKAKWKWFGNTGIIVK